jgi:hypothetical protein
MKTVNHSFHTGHELNVDHPEYIKKFLPKDYSPLVALSKEIVQSRKGATFMLCPAVTDFFKNTWVFKSPIDLNIEINITDDFSSMYCDNVDQEFFNLMVDSRFLQKSEKGISQHPTIGIDLLNTFICESPAMLQVFPAFMHYNDFTSKTSVIPGEYDISKWTRPVELVFEVKNQKEHIKIKKGDALSYFKFNTDDTVKLEKSYTPWEEINICNDLRSADKFKPLKERYSSYKDYKNGQS